jgi:hypothetical protein
MDAPPMFTFHHVNAFTTSTPSSSNGNGNGNGSSSSKVGKRQLVLDTVAWDEVAFENNQVSWSWQVEPYAVVLHCGSTPSAQAVQLQGQSAAMHVQWLFQVCSGFPNSSCMVLSCSRGRSHWASPCRFANSLPASVAAAAAAAAA